MEQWIWLPENLNKTEIQSGIYSGFDYKESVNYIVADFKKSYSFALQIEKAELRFSGDCAFRLFCNEEIVATGPACVGGDFLGNDTQRNNFYAFETVVYPQTEYLNFFAQVKATPCQIYEYSKGFGGFMLSAVLTFKDGSKLTVSTDESWLVRKNQAYVSPFEYDGQQKNNEFVFAKCVENIWNTTTAPIPPRTEKELVFPDGTVCLSPNEEKNALFELDKIQCGFIKLKAETAGKVTVRLFISELKDDEPRVENVTFTCDDEYRSFYLYSAGVIKAVLENNSSSPSEVTISFIETHYPVNDEADIHTSDSELDLVLQTCKHTLKICRQTHHLDSPKHCEPLACTGDYYIETLMTLFSFEDMRLAKFDIIRTAVMLERENGRLFHTTYSLIWVKWLYETFMLTGDKSLLERCETAICLLLKRFETYVGENGLIETPPDYLFIDWIYIDGFSMHHPPKALGQTCLNMFYYGALENAGKIFRILGKTEIAKECAGKREKLKYSVNGCLFDSEKEIYFEGLNTPTSPESVGGWMPKNTEKRYYLKHSNILAAYFGICDDETAKKLVEKIMNNTIEGECQPYFLHFLFEAISRLELCERYTLKLADMWKPWVKTCSKGLVEGFVKPEPGYQFDHSHAWGGTPLYSVPKALLGLKINEAGMKSITLSPKLLGLESAHIEFFTPHGKVVCELNKGVSTVIKAPKEVSITVL